MDSPSQLQNSFHSHVTAYVNGALYSRTDILLSFFSNFLPFVRHAGRISKEYSSLLRKIPENSANNIFLSIEPYRGNNIHVRKMGEYLTENLEDDLVGAYVHGSLGTYEEIPYSDFDALVILKDNIIKDTDKLARVAHKLYRAQAIMFELDPLQHHGWFVLTEADLRYYCDAYFPVDIFRYAKSLFRDKGLELCLKLRSSQDEFKKAFESMAESILRTTNGRHPSNLYNLKSFLSGFMLLPALYVQARDGSGVFKKKSFDLAKTDFDPSVWQIMGKVSQIRKRWSFELSALRKWIHTRPEFLLRHVVKNFSPRIPMKMKGLLMPQFYSEIADLVSHMQKALKD